MSKRITKYDIELANRLEKIRDERGLSKDDMAHLMSVDIGTYKRYAYKISKVPAESVALLCDELELDLTFVMYGRERSKYEFIKFWETVDQERLADMFFETARECRERAKTLAKLKDKPSKDEKKDVGKPITKGTKKTNKE